MAPIHAKPRFQYLDTSRNQIERKLREAARASRPESPLLHALCRNAAYGILSTAGSSNRDQHYEMSLAMVILYRRRIGNLN